MSARYSPIGPLPILWELHHKGILGNYLLLLAHEVLAHPRDYIDLAESLENTKQNPRFIIMDNGVIECGKALTALDVIEAANFVEADCIITPDVLGDFPETQKLVMSQITELRNSGFPLMKVPQGKNFDELIRCADWLNEYLPTNSPDPSLWGIPRWVANQLGTRKGLINYIDSINGLCEMHLLGMSKSLANDALCAQLPNVIGIDSANPIVMGLARLSMRQGEWKHIDRGNYWECKELHTYAAENVEFMHNGLSV